MEFVESHNKSEKHNRNISFVAVAILFILQSSILFAQYAQKIEVLFFTITLVLLFFTYVSGKISGKMGKENEIKDILVENAKGKLNLHGKTVFEGEIFLVFEDGKVIGAYLREGSLVIEENLKPNRKIETLLGKKHNHLNDFLKKKELFKLEV